MYDFDICTIICLKTKMIVIKTKLMDACITM